MIEVETDDSINDSEASGQWKDYSENCNHWHLAVPVGYEGQTRRLLNQNNISNCEVISWREENGGTFSFWGLPGIRN